MSPAVIRRGEWGAGPARGVSRVSWNLADLWVHYTGGGVPGASLESEKQMVQSIQEYHQNSNGWADIGYSYLIAPSGRIFEGRGFGVSGAHCPGHNSEPSVCVMWEDGTRLPPAAALMSVQDLARMLSKARLKGHRDGYSTSCPGAAIYRWVEENRKVPASSGKPPAVNPRGGYLRLDINGVTYTGWDENVGRLRWIRENGLKTPRCGLAWRGPGKTDVGVWRGPVDVRNVARSLLYKFD